MEVTKNGDLITFTINLGNDGFSTDTNVKVTDTLPSGLAYKSWTATKGTFDKTTGVWTVGTLGVGQSAQLKITYIVVDISEAIQLESGGPYGFQNHAIVSGDNVDPNDSNNVKEAFTEVTTCPPSAGAVEDEAACICGTVADNDTPCTHGTTEYRLTPGSITNLDGDFELNVDDGSYNASGMILNPYLPATFQYSIWCIVNGEPLETSGPTLVTIPALFHEDAVDTLTDNGDGTYTHKSLDGTQVTFNAGWTTVTSDSGAKTITFTYPSGATTVVNLSTWFTDGATFTVYASTVVANLSLSAGSLKNHTKIDDSGGKNIAIVIPDPATLGLAANTTQKWVFKRVNDYDTGTISITPDNSKTIDGEPSFNFPNEDYVSVTLWTDGINYFIE